MDHPFSSLLSCRLYDFDIMHNTLFCLMQSKDENYYINNHLSFKVMYHMDVETDDARIVGFQVIPSRCNQIFCTLMNYFLVSVFPHESRLLTWLT